jgi:tetratricopeptide (TPR) repeat protein
MATKRLALIVATSQYIDPTLRQLIAPAQDAKGLTEVLENPNIGNFEVRTLLDESSYRLKQEIEDFFGESRTKDDLLLMYLSCHGIRGQDGQLYYATSDTSRKRLKSTSIEASFVNNLMLSCRALTQILFLDCCHSGAFAKGFTLKSGNSREVHTNQYFEVHDSSRGKLVMTASDAIQYALEGDDTPKKTQDSIAYSVFTKALIQGLESGEADLDGNGKVTYDELYDYVSGQVKQKTPQQTPRKWGFDTEGQIIIAMNPNSQKVKKSRDGEQGKTVAESLDINRLLKLLQDEQVVEFNNIRKNNDIQLRFSKSDLCGKNLTGVDLHGADLSGSNLSGAILNYANMQGANLEAANLTQADIRGSKLYRANLAHANLSKADLRGSDLKGMIDFAGADLSGADMRAVDLDGMVNFYGAILHDVDFTGSITDKALINFNGADIRGAKGIEIPITLSGRQEQGQKINQYVESVKSFSEAIVQKFKVYNIPAEQLKPIEESVKDLAKEVEDIQEPEKITWIKKKNLDRTFVDVVSNVIKALPRAEERAAIFDPLNPLGNLIADGQGIQQTVKEIEKDVDTTAKNAEMDSGGTVSKLAKDGEELNNLGRYEEAIKILDKALEIDASYVVARYSKGVSLHNLGKYQDAVECYDRALEIKPDHVSALYSKGLALSNLNKFDEAINSYDKALSINPNYTEARNNRDDALAKTAVDNTHDPTLPSWYHDQYSRDKIEETKAAKTWNEWNEEGISLFNLGRYDEALEYFGKALALNPNDSVTLSNKGSTLVELKRYSEAIEFAAKSLALNPNNAKAWNLKGVAYSWLGRNAEALGSYEKALAIDPNYQAALDNKLRLVPAAEDPHDDPTLPSWYRDVYGKGSNSSQTLPSGYQYKQTSTNEYNDPTLPSWYHKKYGKKPPAPKRQGKKIRYSNIYNDPTLPNYDPNKPSGYSGKPALPKRRWWRR